MTDRSLFPATTTTTERLLYSREEVAQLLSLSVHTVTRDVRRGSIRAKRYGRRVLIPREEVLRIAAEGLEQKAKR
jgi:excisionase family DNA binding protein